MTDRWGEVPVWVVDRLRTQPTTLAFYATLSTWRNEETGEAWPSQTTIAETMGRSEGTIRRCVAECKRVRVLSTRPRLVGRSKVGNIYVFLSRDGSPMRDGARIRARSSRARDPLPKKEQQTMMNKEIEPGDDSKPVVAVVTTGKLLVLPNTPEIVFAEWLRATGREPGRYHLTAKRTTRIRQLLAQGYSVDDLCAAARGVMRSAWFVEHNLTGFDDVFKDAERVEKFRDLDEEAPHLGAAQAAHLSQDPAVAQIARLRDMRRRSGGA